MCLQVNPFWYAQAALAVNECKSPSCLLCTGKLHAAMTGVCCTRIMARLLHICVVCLFKHFGGAAQDHEMDQE